MTLLENIARIIKDLTRLRTVPLPHRDERGAILLPRMIAIDDDRSIIVSETADRIILDVADQLLALDSKLAATVTRKEWRAAVRAAFGPVLANIDLDEPVDMNASAVLNDIRSALNERTSRYGQREITFGCSLFGNVSIEPFSIGPVRFEPRHEWLLRRRSEGAISTTSLRRIQRAWSGHRLRERKPSFDAICEKGIVDTLETCPFVCSVVTIGLAPYASQEKALVAARIAITAIALLWQTPSQTLRGINLLFDRRVHFQRYLTSESDRPVLFHGQMSSLPDGPGLKDGEWEALLLERSAYFGVVAEILDHMISTTSTVTRPRMLKTLLQSLLWFHEGCRETVALMGIVKLSASLDALACGGKSGGIKRLITARLGIAGNAPIRLGGPTLNAAIDRIYSSGRSRTLHGNNEELGHDWTGTKDLAEQFARLCLLTCIDWVARNPECDDPKQLSTSPHPR